MIISNSCILPEGWTVDTFMELHDSKPYNPDTLFEKRTEKEGTGRNSRERCPLSNKIPLLRWAVTKVAVHLPFCINTGIAGCQGRRKKRSWICHPKRFYSNFTQKSGLNGVFRGVQNFDTFAKQMFGRFWPQDVRPLFCLLFFEG